MQKEQIIHLESIVPEYRSKWRLVRNLFWSRIYNAVSFIPRFENKKEINVLEIGMGEGVFLKTFVEKRSDLKERVTIYGCDFNLHLSKLPADIRNQCVIITSDARKLPFKSKKFDVVVALDVLEHIKDVGEALDEISRVLVADGTFIISAPTENFLQKCARFLMTGKLSRTNQDASGIHYHNAYTLKRDLQKRLVYKETKNLPSYSPIPILKVMKFEKKRT
jgi:ubiquinone/menaquinone biosynthesis C-methylase UbiE